MYCIYLFQIPLAQMRKFWCWWQHWDCVSKEWHSNRSKFALILWFSRFGGFVDKYVYFPIRKRSLHLGGTGTCDMWQCSRHDQACNCQKCMLKLCFIMLLLMCLQGLDLQLNVHSWYINLKTILCNAFLRPSGFQL